MSSVLLAIGTIMLLTSVAGYMVVRAAVSERSLRRILLLSVLITPPVAIYAFVKRLVRPAKPVPFIEGLGNIEDEIEAERARTFGGKVMRPSFSESWKRSYLYALEKSAATAAKRLGPIHHHSC